MDHFIRMEESAGTSTGFLWNFICILTLSQKIKRFLSHSHQLERPGVEMCSLLSAFVLCCKHPTATGTTTSMAKPWWLSKAGKCGGSWALWDVFHHQWWPESHHGSVSVPAEISAGGTPDKQCSSQGEQHTSLAAKTLWEVLWHFRKSWFKFRLQHLHSLP